MEPFKEIGCCEVDLTEKQYSETNIRQLKNNDLCCEMEQKGKLTMRDNLVNMLRAAAKEWREENKFVGVGETRYDVALEEAANAIEELNNK